MIRKLLNSQVHDPARGFFFVKLEGTKQKAHGLPVWRSKVEPDAREFVITDAEIEA